MISTIINGSLAIVCLGIIAAIVIAFDEIDSLKKEIQNAEPVSEEPLTDKELEMLDAIAEVLSYDGNIKKEAGDKYEY